jgi:hypothetical protein
MPLLVEVFRMTDEQWRSLCECQPLPPPMRAKLDVIIFHSRKMAVDVETHGKPSETRERLERILEKTRSLLNEFKPLPPDVAVAMVKPEPPANEMGAWTSGFVLGSPGDAIAKLEGIMNGVAALETWLGATLSRTSAKSGTRGRKSDHVAFLVRQLDILLGQCGLPRVSQSDKRGGSSDLVREIVEIAHPATGRGTVQEAVKEAVRHCKADTAAARSETASRETH